MSSKTFKYPLLRALDEAFIRRLKQVYVCYNGSTAIMITQNDEVYAISNDDKVRNVLGLNTNPVFGFGKTTDDSDEGKTTEDKDEKNAIEHVSEDKKFGPRIIEALSDKRITHVTAGGGKSNPLVLFLSGEGKIFTWGSISFVQVGDKSLVSVSTSPATGYLYPDNLLGHHVVSVACGYGHCLALTRDGDVFAWGANDHGQCVVKDEVYSTPVNVTPGFSFGTSAHSFGSAASSVQLAPSSSITTVSPIKVKIPRPVKAIYCGYHHSAALTTEGLVYTWGKNENGQLGRDGTVAVDKVNCLKKHKMIQIVCGRNHTIVISNYGLIFIWGANNAGQLGNSTMPQPSTQPLQLLLPRTSTLQVSNIAARYDLDISAAQTHSGEVYVWGQCGKDMQLQKPLRVAAESIDEVLTTYYGVTYTPMELKHRNIEDAISVAFNDPDHSDIKFKVDGKELHANKTILKLRCEHFDAMFNSEWKEAQGNEITIEHFSYDVYKAFLQFIYTDKLNVDTEIALDLLDLAQSYCETQLKYLCECIIGESIDIDNVSTFYSAAVKYDCRELIGFCTRYAYKNWSNVFLSDEFDQIDLGIAKALVRGVAALNIE